MLERRECTSNKEINEYALCFSYPTNVLLSVPTLPLLQKLAAARAKEPRGEKGCTYAPVRHAANAVISKHYGAGAGNLYAILPALARYMQTLDPDTEVLWETGEDVLVHVRTTPPSPCYATKKNRNQEESSS